MKGKLHSLFIVLALLGGIKQLAAQGTTAFTYQGQLQDGGTNANGAYTMIFALYDAASSGNQVGGAITNSPTLANGLFSVNLDFGSGAFSGSACWLDITVQSGSASEELSPRVQVLPTPYAIFAGTAGTANHLSGTFPASQLTGTLLSAQLGGTYSNAVNFNNGPQNNFNGAFNGAFAGDGRALINVNAGLFGGLSITNFALLAALTNYATLPLGANVVATTNIQDGAVTDSKISSRTTLTFTVAETNLVFIRGTIDLGGAIVSGQGFTVSVTSPTNRTINFDTAFSSIPTIALGQHGSSGSSIVDLVSSSTSGFSTVANGFAGFEFIAFGPR